MGQVVYIVTSGSYSDYQINGVFDSKEQAQAFIKYVKAHDDFGAWGHEEPNIEEWTLNEFTDPISRGLTHFKIQFKDIQQGDATVIGFSSLEGDGVESSGQFPSENRRWYQTSVWTTDEASALKIANERRARYIIEHRL